MDLVVELRGNTYYIDTAIVTPFSSNAGLITAASARPRLHGQTRREGKSSTDTPASTWSHSSSGPQGRPGYHESSSNTSTTTRTNHQQPFGTPGRPFKPPCTTASLNKQLRAVTHVTAMTVVSSTLPHFTTSAPLPMFAWTTLPLTTHAAPVHTRLSFAVANSQVQCHFLFLHSVSILRHVCSATTQASTGTRGTPAPDAPTLAMHTGYERFPRPAPRVQPLVTFGKSKLEFHGPLSDAKSDLLHAQYRLSLLQRNAGAARRQPTQLVTAMCGAFNAVLLQEAHDHVSHISDQFNT